MTVSKYYKEYNPNPQNKEVGDCVIRALCAVTNKTWLEVYDELSELGRNLACPFSCIDIKDYDLFTELYNMTRHKVTREKGKKALDVSKFCKEHPTGKYVLRLAGHLMGVVNGKYYELYAGWEDATIYTFWEVA